MLRNYKINSEIDDKDFQISYQNHCNTLSKARLKITIVLAMLLVMGFGMLDIVFYPDVAKTLIKTRIATDMILILVFVALLKDVLCEHVNKIGIFVVILIFVSIDILIFLTEGMSSPYYAGLILTLVAFSAMLPWKSSETLFSFLSILLSYLITVFLHSKINGLEYDLPSLTNNLFFLVSVGTFCVIATYLNSGLRFREFYLNYNLDYNLKKETMRLRSAQAQLIQSEKINAMGNLSAGILHEINNPLNYAIAAVRIVRMDDKVSEDADLKDTVADIEEGMMRIKNIVSDLHNFAHPEESDKHQHFPIANAVESAIRFTAAECKDIERIIDVSKDLMVSASKTHIVQILINLITNGCKAIAKADRQDNNSGVIKIWTEQKNNRIIIFVSDNGIGMNEETLAKVFDPFFTTSEVGKGMGMGLSVSYTIAKNHGGTLSATSKLGIGSVFSFDLST